MKPKIVGGLSGHARNVRSMQAGDCFDHKLHGRCVIQSIEDRGDGRWAVIALANGGKTNVHIVLREGEEIPGEVTLRLDAIRTAHERLLDFDFDD